MPNYALTSPYDNRVYRLDDSAEADRLVNMGYTESTPEQIKHEELVKSFDNWKGQLVAAGTSFMDAVPGVNALVSQFDDPANVKYRLEQGELAREANPNSGTAGTLAGVGATIAMTAPLSAAAAVAAKGAAVAGAGAAGLSATGTAISTYAAAAGASGLEAMGIGKLGNLDNAALQHAIDPEGSEKLAAEGGSGWRDFAIGAGAHAVLGGIAKAFGVIGKKAEAFSVDQFKKQLGANQAMQATLDVARQDSVWKTAEAAGVMGKTAAEAKPVVMRRLEEITREMNEVKEATKGYKLDGPARQQAQKAMEQALEGTPLHGQVASWYSKDLSVYRLQMLRKKIYSSIDWVSPLEGHGPKCKDAGLYIGQQIKAVLAKADIVPGSSRAQQWASLDREYSDLMVLRNTMGKGGGAAAKAAAPAAAEGGYKWIQGMMGWGAIGTVAHSALGPAGSVAVGAIAAAKKLVETFKAGGFAKAAQELDKVFSSSANKLATTVEAGLYGVPQAIHVEIDHQADYEKAAAQIAAVRASPEKAYQQMADAASKAGIPDDVAAQLVERKHTQMQYLGQQLPGRIGASDLPTRSMPDPAAQRKWLGKLRTSEDPSYGFANPTAANMDILKRFYPGMVTTMQQTLYAQLQKNPDAPAEAKLWASRVMGRPMTHLASPSYIGLMAKMRDQEQQAPQAGSSGKSHRGGGAMASVDSGMTRLEQLSGG